MNEIKQEYGFQEKERRTQVESTAIPVLKLAAKVFEPVGLPTSFTSLFQALS